MLGNSKILGDVVCYLATGEVHTYELLDKEILVADEEGAGQCALSSALFVKKTRPDLSALSGNSYHNHKLVIEATVPLAFEMSWRLGM